MKHVWRRLTPLLGVALLLVASLALRHQFQDLTLDTLWKAFGGLPPVAVVLAVLMTAVNYAVLTGYDQLAFIYLGRRFPRWRIALASFVGYAISNSLGFAMLSGATARYRFYSRWGLTAPEISRIVVFYSGTFWLGLLVLGGWSLAVHPPSGLVDIAGHRWALPFGVVLMALPALYLTAALVKRGPIAIRIFGWALDIKLPSVPLVGAQFGLSILDWALAAGVFWMLIPGPRPPFAETMSAFMAAQFVGLLSNVPGALVIFEASIVKLLGPTVPLANLLAALLAFRAIYYVLPLIVGLAALAVDEWVERRHMVSHWGRRFGALTVSLAPPLIGGFAFVAGAVLLFSGVTPAAAERIHWLEDAIPLWSVELSHFIGSLVGLGLLLLSQALIRRVDASWTLAVGIVAVGIVAEILKGLDFEEATVLVLLLVLLIRSRKEFDRRATLFEHTFSGGWFTAVSLVVLASIVVGVYAFRHGSEGQFDWWRFQFAGDESRFLRATVGVAIVLLAVGIRFLLRSSAPRLQLPTDRDLADAERVIAAQDSSTPYLLYLNDKAILWNESRTAFLMYAVGGRTWVVLGDPVGPSKEVRGLIRRFLEMVDDAEGVPVFYQVRKDNLHRYADFGLVFAKAGEEALVPLPSFSLEGGARKKMRLFQHKLEKDGATYRIVPASGVPAILPELRQISDEWLVMKAGSEKGFSLGFFNESYLKRFPVIILEAGGRIEAFANIWPGPSKVELSVDLMRHRPTAPKNAMEGLFIHLMQWGKAEGYQTFNLGMVALSGLEHSEFAPFWTTFASYVYRYGRTFYNFEGLRAYKDKFDPVWEPKYLAYPGGRALPLVMLDVSALIAGGYRRVLLR